ncbi:hypothetical protein D9M72_463220 [compost metagenome]
MQPVNRKTDGFGLGGIEGVQQEIAPFDGENTGGDQGDHAGLGDVAPADAEHVAEEDVVEVHVALDLGVEHQPEAEHAGEDHAHHRILLDAAVFLEIAGQKRAGHAGGKGADGKRQADDVGDDDAGEDRMRDRVAHQRPALQHQETGEHGGRDRHQHRDQKRVAHELEFEDRKQHVERDHRAASIGSALRLRAASSPCFGAKTKAVRKMSVCSTMMMPPVAPSRK